MISIVTITKDDREGLTRTAESINLLYRSTKNSINIEWIVVDDSNNIDVRDILLRLQAEGLQVVRVRSTKGGIYNAMNCGVAQSRGEWIHFLNGGDELYDEKVYNIINDRIVDEKIGIVVGSTCVVGDQCGSRIRKARRRFPWIYHGVTATQQSWLVKRNVFNHIWFDESFNVCGDYAFEAMAYVKNIKCVVVLNVISRFHLGGISSKRTDILQKEAERVQRDVLGMSEINIMFSRWLRRLTQAWALRD